MPESTLSPSQGLWIWPLGSVVFNVHKSILLTVYTYLRLTTELHNKYLVFVKGLKGRLCVFPILEDCQLQFLFILKAHTFGTQVTF
jgi:hypothetical protein